MVGLTILAVVYISSMRTGYIPDTNYIIISLGVIAVVSVLMVFVVNMYSIQFEYDHFEWRDFVKKNEILYSTITQINAYMGMKGKQQYSYFEIYCSTREKPTRVDTKYFDKQSRSEIIRLINMKCPDAKLNKLALDLKEMKYKEYAANEKKIIIIAAFTLVLVALKVAAKIWLK
jgi:hypothetical protein